MTEHISHAGDREELSELEGRIAALLGGCERALKTLEETFQCPDGSTAKYLRVLIQAEHDITEEK